MAYVVRLSHNGYRYNADEPYVEALRQIIEANYNFARNKYGADFEIEKVREYQCVKIATKTLCDHGFVVEINHGLS